MPSHRDLMTSASYGANFPGIFENDGYFKESVQGVFRRFYTEWLPFSGYEYAGLPDIEVYPVVEDGTIHGHSEVWIAIKKKEKNI